jgi:hypothetical protein
MVLNIALKGGILVHFLGFKPIQAVFAGST